MWTRYVALGDSITEGYGDPVDGEPRRSWTDWVADGLARDNPAFVYRNLGLRASTALDVLRQQVPVAADLAPDLVTLTVGANDALRPDWSLAEFGETYARILASFADRDASLVTACYPDFGSQLADAGQPVPHTWTAYFDRVRATNDTIRRLSASMDAFVIDYEQFPPLLDLANVSSDLVHPNGRGYRLAGLEALARISAHYHPQPI